MSIGAGTDDRTVAYLGPRGSFAEAAVLAWPGSSGAQLLPSVSVPAALKAVRGDVVDHALVPIENSVEGSVSATLDELGSGQRLVIVDEVVLPVQFALLARPGVSMDQISRIATHPHAQAQVRHWLAAHLPEVSVIPAMSTASAAAALLEDPAPFDGAISQRIAADIYGLDVLADEIADTTDATTRFVVVRKPGSIPEPTGADKTTLSLFIHQDQPGALLGILNEFAVRGVNMTRIESRPTRKALGDYYFSVDVEGHVADARISEAMMGLHRVCLDVRYLGSYPRHDGKEPVLRDGVTDSDFAEAREWFDRLKENG
ncbi:MAG TPA: prephenate dehydratase [Candidatus Nanopelagicales bacterium]|nr:prephenate dehydratase [Candidatus Nanopelagicales bacterium]